MRFGIKFKMDKFVHAIQKPDDWIIISTLTPIILSHVKGCIVEIGAGRSTEIFVRVANKIGVDFYTCDLNTEKLKIIEVKMRQEFPPRESRIFFYGINSFRFIREFEINIKENPAVVFIDGCHQYEIARIEVYYFLEKLLVGGVMFLHDTLPPSEIYIRSHNGDVYRLRQELEGNPDLDCFTWPYTANGFGLTMVLKKPVERPYYRL